MERIQEHTPRPTAPPPAQGPITEAPADVADVARAAAAGAAAVACAPATVTVTVKTTGAHHTQIVATPDTTMGEVMTQACADLGVKDTARWVLVANGEVIADGARTLKDVVGDKLGTGLNTRLVKKPEAGEPCPS
jgi:hypothetical protein